MSFDGPGTPDGELYSHCIDIGRSPLEAFQDAAPVEPDLVEPADEYTFRELATATRHGSSYEEWAQALPAWAALDKALHDVT